LLLMEIVISEACPAEIEGVAKDLGAALLERHKMNAL